MFKGEHKKFKKKLLTYFLCNKILSENFLFYNKLDFRKAREFYFYFVIFCYNTIFKHRLLFIDILKAFDDFKIKQKRV